MLFNIMSVIVCMCLILPPLHSWIQVHDSHDKTSFLVVDTD